MREVITITPSDSNAINMFLAKHTGYTEHLNELDFTCRYPFNGISMLIDFKGDMRAMHFKCREENAMLTQKVSIPTCEFSVKFENGEVKFLNMPKDRKASDWLMTFNKKRSVGSEIIYICIHACVALSHFKPLLMSRTFADRIEYRLPTNFYKQMLDFVTYKKKVENKNKLLDGWDVVNLTSNQMNKMGKILSDNKIPFDFVNISLPKFCISLFDGNDMNYWFYEYKGRELRCGVVNYFDYSIRWFTVELSDPFMNNDELTIHMELVESDNLEQWALEEAKGNKAQMSNWEWVANTFFGVNTFMLHYGDVSMEVEEKQAIAPSAPQKKRSASRSTVHIFKQYHLIKNWTTKARKKAEYTCLAWGVRGHFRHYRNGKTVFVEAYVKGKEKDQYKGKDYALLPYKDA